MSIRRVAIKDFVSDLKAAEKRRDGYIMGSRGQNPKKWAKNSWWFTQYSGAQKAKALYWRENAQRVWDCNGLAEGIYEDHTGVNINTKARFNYAQWCNVKGEGAIPAKYRVPGAAVFIHSASKGYITHVGYLVEPIKADDPAGDWWVIEARGVMYGVVKTRLSGRGWNRWGLMQKYFDYGDMPEKQPKNIKITGESVNVRADPGTGGRVLGVAHKGDELEYGGEDSAGGWHKVNYKGKIGWVSGKYSEVG